MAEKETGVARSAQHAVHVLPHAPHVINSFLAPALERITADAEATQVLIITPDADTALAIADAARALDPEGDAPVVPITAAGRGARILASRVTPAIAAAPSTLVSMLRTSAVKLDSIRAVVIAWADELVDARESETLEIVLGEIPKEASRTVIADRITPDVETLVERHLRRASRHGAAAEGEAPALAIRYVTTASSGRRNALRRLLDDLDPPSAIIIANDAGAADEARSAVAALGYKDETLVRVVTAPIPEQAAVVVLYDLPSTSADVAAIAATEAAQVVALVTPRQVPTLRRLTAGPVEPLDVSQVTAKARARDERLRAAIRNELAGGFPAREVMALEPLLAEFDGLEIAAAAVRVIERQRGEAAAAKRVEAERPVERTTERAVERAERPERTESRPAERERSAPRGEEGFTRLFMSIGERDGVRASDLVGAIAGESGIPGSHVGKIEIRDSHSVAEVNSADAATVVEKMNGTTIKGRSLTVRIDDRPAPRSRERSSGDRDGRRPAGRFGGGSRDRDSRGGGRGFGGPRREGRGDREGRGGDREGRGGDRPPRTGDRPRGGDREGRPSRFARDDRPRSGPPRGRGDRPERSDRGERGDRSERRGPRDAGGPPRSRGGFRDRDDGRVPRATRERDEWSERADRVRNARRPRRDAE